MGNVTCEGRVWISEKIFTLGVATSETWEADAGLLSPGILALVHALEKAVLGREASYRTGVFGIHGRRAGNAAPGL